ncbi:MAG: hypothetical protein WC934_14445 [Acidithiobacillus sp.]
MSGAAGAGAGGLLAECGASPPAEAGVLPTDAGAPGDVPAVPAPALDDGAGLAERPDVPPLAGALGAGTALTGTGDASGWGSPPAKGSLALIS